MRSSRWNVTIKIWVNGSKFGIQVDVKQITVEQYAIVSIDAAMLTNIDAFGFSLSMKAYICRIEEGKASKTTSIVLMITDSNMGSKRSLTLAFSPLTTL